MGGGEHHKLKYIFQISTKRETGSVIATDFPTAEQECHLQAYKDNFSLLNTCQEEKQTQSEHSA